MGQSKKNIHRVAINYYDKHYYVVGLVQLPPIYAWDSVPPVLTIPEGDKEKFTQAIESARLISKPREQLTSLDLEHKALNSEEEKMLDNASKLWTVSWEEGGNVHITPWERFPPGDYKGVAWRPIIKAEKILSPPVSSQDIAQEIINQSAVENV